MVIFIKLFALLPFWLLHQTSNVMAFLAYHVFRYRRKVVWTNLSNSFPEKTQKEIWTLVKSFYINLFDVFFETLKLYHLSTEELKQRVELIDSDIATQDIQKGISCIFMTTHLSNWEWMLARWSVDYPVDGVYLKVYNPFWNKLMLYIRGKHGAHLIERQALPRAMYDRKDITRAIGLISDQGPLLVNTAYWTNFFHQDTPFFTGGEKLAEKFSLPVFYACMQRKRRGNYTLSFKKLAEPPYIQNQSNITELYVRELEKDIRNQPANWLWSHKRWKRAHLKKVSPIN